MNNCTKKAIYSLNFLERVISSNQNDKKSIDNYKSKIKEVRLNYCDIAVFVEC